MLGDCPICGRALVSGPSVDEHHLIPKSRGGKDTITIHRVCHTKIHSLFTNKELEQEYNTVQALTTHAGMRSFIRWVAKKPPEFYISNKESRRKKKRR